MTIVNPTCPSPSETDPLYQNGFLLTVTAFPELSFWCKSITTSDVSLPSAEYNTPFQRVPLPGTVLDFGQITCTVIADKNLTTYRALYDWMRLISFKDNFAQVREWIDGHSVLEKFRSNGETILTSDATLSINGPNKQVVGQMVLRMLWPTNLSGLTFTEENTDSTTVEYTVSFQLRDFDFT